MSSIRLAQLISVLIALTITLGAAGYGIVRGFTYDGHGAACEAYRRQVFDEVVRRDNEQGFFDVHTPPRVSCDAYPLPTANS